ncbi:hypothetical protein ACW7GW_08575 [Staphylococcus capitis subsp. urealyticus]|jgi:protein AbiQ|uniref:hypothetical protein n=1 Tax=Staphylococcus capitis TaxID=29388 RepID=UPI0003BE1EA6|nr:hypothetical protein [Staphylococcus capitis]CDI72093.1 conserved hypothetical protein [Staphylococcus capitis CR01]DAM78034.1 MAG TPA: hypothetical protein [Caudoviricetes sp.]MDH9631047.1 hypothetical protein [Staphylococcus capitis]MDH9979574.1 hypothetical protein [Staphylococcus capitis]MDK8528605.1 hypothetical protein [Staphylococcus capitis]
MHHRNDFLIENLLNGKAKQILYNYKKGSGNKPYYYNLKYNDNNILIPFRSNSERISTKYKLETNHIQTDRKKPAIDCSKVLILKDSEIVNFTKSIFIEEKLFKFVKRNKKAITKKFNNHLRDYIDQKSKLIDNKTVQFSTLQYFHKELNLDEKIMSKRKSVLINELEKNGESKFFKKLVNTVEKTE